MLGTFTENEKSHKLYDAMRCFFLIRFNPTLPSSVTITTGASLDALVVYIPNFSITSYKNYSL